MKIIEKAGTPDGPQIDWDRPIVEFDPWPFDKDSVTIEMGRYLRSDGSWSDLGPEWVLSRVCENVLGYTTDGHPFVARKRTITARLS